MRFEIMKAKLETERLILREVILDDVDDFFEMDSDPEVHKYISNAPLKTKEQVVAMIEFFQRQYIENGIARWAVVLKETGEFIGWSGLKFMNDYTVNGRTDFYDLGYRFKKKHWGKGYASESGKAVVDYVRQNMDIDCIYGFADALNDGSRSVLQKSGLKYVEDFEYEGRPASWYELKLK